MKSKRELLLITSIAIGIFLIANVSASLYFSQLDSVYNIGDMIEMKVNATPADSGPLKIVLMCDNSTLDVYKGSPTELIQLPLTTLWMNGLTGECHFTGYYGGESIQSTIFKISKKLEVNLYTTTFYSNPGEAIKITGNAKRLNGEAVNGEVQVIVPVSGANGGNEKIYGAISNGEFSIDYTVKKETAAGEYKIDVIAYEKTENEKTSEGIATASIKVAQVIKNVDLAIDTKDVEPGKSINFKPILNDQSDNPLAGNVAVEITDKNSNIIFQKIVGSGETIELAIPTNMTSGYYSIEASSNPFSKVQNFHVSEKALVSFELVNGTLVIRNIGNIPYNKTIEVTINGKTFFIKPEQLGGAIDTGEKKEFKLKSDRELNSVTIADGVTNLSMSEVQLPVAKEAGVGITGAAIGLSDLANTPITWIIILLILGAIILFLFRDVFKKSSVTYPVPFKSNSKTEVVTSSNRIISLDKKGKEIKSEPMTRIFPMNVAKKEMEEKGIGEKSLAPKPTINKKIEVNYFNPSYAPYKSAGRTEAPKQEIKPKTPDNYKEFKKDDLSDLKVSVIPQKKESSPNKAEQVLVTDGQKSRAAVIAIKIKNTINKFSKENLEKAIEHVYDKRGAVYEHGNFIFVIFTPLITKSFRNEIEAAKTAERIADALKEHNKKFNDKINFGIGVNSGDIINKVENKVLKFTSLGTLTIAAKKLAEFSEGAVLLTKDAYEKSMAEVNATKKEIQGVEVHELKKVADYDKNKKFINDFLKREKETRNKNMIPGHSVSPR